LLHEGKKVEEGQPKKVADVYKQVLLNSGSFKEVEPASVPNFNATRVKQSDWKKSFTVNPNLLEYGSKEAEIVDYGIFDNEGATTTNVLSEESCVIKMRVRFNESIDEPIFAFSIKDIKGAELVGTNTFIEHVETRTFQSNDEIIITFTQALRLQAGPYALSLGCTKYEGEGLVVFHRLYDVLLFEVISTRSIFGMFDVHSEIELIKL
jgi:teichoic acid transport system ATP-binding protein